MARTKASVGAKMSSGKSSKARCSVAPPSSVGPTGSSEKSRGTSGGNPVCPRETPKWQKPITNFLIAKNSSQDSDDEVDDISGNSSKQKRNVIESDDETADGQDGTKDVDVTENQEDKTEDESDRPKNQVLDETIELEPLNGEDSHKIDEYYPKSEGKGKGRGKKSNKENVNSNIQKRESVKRDLEASTFGEDTQGSSKRIKVN